MKEPLPEVSSVQRIGPLPATHHASAGAAKGPPVLLLHGLGLGRWIWRRDQALLAALGLETWAVDLPGHGDNPQSGGLDAIVEAVGEAAAALGEPAIVGHSFSTLVAQRLAARRSLASITLVAPFPPAEVPYRPTREMVAVGLRQLPRLALGRRGVDPKAYLAGGFDLLPEPQRSEALERVTPPPPGLVRDLMRRPSVAAESVRCPILVTHGFKDRVASLWGSRLIADHYDAPIWRFDDLAHNPMLEPGGERHARAVAGWILAPHGRKITEIDPMAPGEGVGQAARSRRHTSKVRSDSPFRRGAADKS